MTNGSIFIVRHERRLPQLVWARLVGNAVKIRNNALEQAIGGNRYLTIKIKLVQIQRLAHLLGGPFGWAQSVGDRAWVDRWMFPELDF